MSKTIRNYNKWNYHDKKIRQTHACNIWNHWTAVLISLGLISNAYCDLPHWRSNQRPQNAELKLYVDAYFQSSWEYTAPKVTMSSVKSIDITDKTYSGYTIAMTS